MEFVVPPRMFSLREANACIPTLQRTFTHARTVRERLEKLQVELKKAGHPIEGTRVRIEEGAPLKVQRLQSDAADCVVELLEILRGVTDLGAEVKAAEGLVDFRSRYDGRVVYLCWKFDEEQISHFHELDAGIAGRQALPDGGEFTGDPLH